MALNDIKIEKKQKLGSNFGGGWGLGNWVKQSQEEDEEEKEKITLSDIKIEKPQIEPKEENKQVEQSNPFLELNNSIIEQYEKLNNMQKELQEKQQALQQAPDVLKPSLMATYEVKLTEYNDMFKQFNENIKQRDAMIQEQQQKRLDIERLQGSMGRPFKEPTWGEVITNSLKAGLASYQSSLLNIARLIQTGAVKATDKITDIFDKDWYDPENDFVLNYLTKLVEDSEKIATQSAEQAKAKNWLKQFLGTGLQAVPQILGSWFLGGAIPTMSALKSAGYAPKVAEFIDQAKRMIPFGIGAAGAHTREVEKEFEELGKEAPYFSTLFYGIVSGMAEMATELPVFTGVSKILKGNTKLINEGAKTFISKYGKGAYEIGKNIILQAAQEAEIEPIVNSVAQAIGLEREKIVDLEKMGEAAYGGLAMAVIMGGLGGATVGVAKGTANVTERIMKSAEEGNIRRALEIINNEAGFVRIRRSEGEGEGKKEEVTPKPTEETKVPEEGVEQLPQVEPKPPEVTMPEKEELVTEPTKEKVIPKEIKFYGKLTNDKLKDTLQKKGVKQGDIIYVDGKKIATIGKIAPSKQWSDKEQKFIELEGLVDIDILGKEKHLTTLYGVKLPQKGELVTKPAEEEMAEQPPIIEQKFPEVNTQIKEDIKPKIEEAIKQELPKITPKMPDIDVPRATELIMSKVEENIQRELNLRTEIKPSDIPDIEIKIEKKLPEIVKKELPKLKIEPKTPEITIPKEPWQMTKKEIKNWEIQVPEGGSSKSPSTVLNWNREEYETLLDLAKLDDKYRFNESLTGSGRKDVDPLLKNKILKNEPIKIYRVSDVGDIIPGSYVSESLDYVKKHQENIMQGKGKIYSKIVKPSELMSYGDPHEFIYIPENIESYHKPIIQQALSEGKPVPAEVLADYPELKAELKPPTKLEEKPEEVLEKVKEPEAKEEIPKAEVAKPEAIPEKTKVTPEISKIDDLIVKTNRIKTDIEKTIKMMVDSHTKYLIETSGKGVDMGLIPTEEGGYTRYAVSQNPVWYQKLFKAKGRTPTKAEIREEAESQLREGLIEENIPPDSEFLRMEAQVEAWDTLLDTLKSIKEGLAEVEPTKEVVKIIENIKDVKPQKITQAKIQQVSGKLEKELNAQIMSQKEKKGLSNKEFEAIKVRITEKMSGQAKHKLTSKVPRYTISLEEKLEILKAINKVRPKRIGYQRVITKKTEDKIESLKNTYMKEVGMTIEDWHEILAKENLQKTVINPETGEKEIVYREPKYISGREFITEKKGKEIIKRLNNKYYVLKAVNPYKKAVETNSFKEEGDFSKLVNSIQEKIDKVKHKDPKEWWSMRYVVMQNEKQTKQPIYRVWQTIIDTNNALKRKRNSVLKELNEIEGFKEIAGKPAEIKKVEDLILSEIKWLENKPEKPTDIDERHTNIANKIKSILKDYEVKAMVARFIDKADRLQELPQYEEYKKDLIKARDIYETKGVEELIKFIHQKYNEGNTLGLIRKNGYLPDLMINHKIRMYEPPADSLSTSHIEVKNNVYYMPQEKNILQRLPAYMRQIDMLTEIRGLLQGLIEMYEDNYNTFDNPDRVLSIISYCIKEMKNWGMGDTFFDRLFERVYAQVAKVIIKASPVLSFRNLLQPFANMTDKLTLFDPRNKKLSNDRVEYIETYVSQTEQMLSQFFLTNQKSLFEHIPVLKQLDHLIDKINIYPISDRINRLETFWAKINEIDRALETSKNLSELLNKINFHELDEIQQLYAIEEFALNGEEAFARYVARVETDNTQFRYAREERAPMEMGKTGKILSNLLLFTRAYIERIGRAGKGMIRRGAPFRERLRHFKTIAAMIIGGMIADAIIKKATGRTQGSYNLWNMFGYSIGGLQLAAVQQANETWILIVDALRGDERSLRLLPTALSKTGDMFIPFYRWFMDGVEAMTDKQQIDRLAMRKIMAMIDDEYKPSESYYDLERTTYEKWLHFFGGGSVDFTIKERKAKERKAMQEREEIHKKSSGLSASQQLDKILGKSSGLSASEQLNKILKR